MGLFVGKLGNVVNVDLKATYLKEAIRLIRHYPDASCYAYYKENMTGYGFIRDSIVEIIDDKEG